MNKAISLLLLTAVVLSVGLGQGLTTAALNGVVLDKDGNPLPGAVVMAIHQPSGTKYGTTTREDGNYNLANLRAGGPYVVSVSLLGYTKMERGNITLQLSQTLRQDFRLSPEAVELEAVEVTAERGTILNQARTGAATAVDRKAIEVLPTITRRIQDFVRLTPQVSGNASYGGLDNRFNNTTVDGSYFNNSFGLQGQPGDRTGVAPISVEAIEQVQVNIAPYDVRQSNFIGAGVNSITRSGTNQFSGSAYYIFRHQGLVGTEADTVKYKPGTFRYNQVGVRLGGPILENKLFFFTSFESDLLTQPGTTYRANLGGEPVGGNTTRVLKSDLDNLSTYLRTKFGYETGPYEGYNNETPAMRFIGKLDYNLDEKNKLVLRYIHLDSQLDVLESNSSSLGTGSRNLNTSSLNYQNSNYAIMENIRNIVTEWNSILADNMSNNLIVGYSYHDESRKPRGQFFPLVDVLGPDKKTYLSFGFEPFTPNNELRYWNFQIQDNFNYSLKEHYLTLGASIERYESENIFFPGSQSVYVFNSLSDFYNSANAYLNGTPDTTTVSLFQVRWSNIPGQTKPIQPLKVWYVGAYAQDEYMIGRDIKLSAGLRLEVPFFENTGYRNAEVETFTFKDENGNPVKYKTDKLPDANILWSPRFGFNWDVSGGERTTQLRGGTGIFTGKPAYVWISNQIGNNGILTGFESLKDTKLRPFNPNPNRYKPTTVTGAPASKYELALTDPNFKFPQIWRSNIAVDQRLPYNLIATAEFLYGKDVNGIYYINANLDKPNAAFTGVDKRPHWTTPDTSKIVNKIDNAIVMKNQDVGYSWNLSFALEKPFSDGWFAKAAYSYGESKNTVDPGSIASGSYYSNPHSGDPNNPGVGFSQNSPGHRVFVAVSYRAEYFDIGATTFSLFWEGRTQGNASYVFSADANGDGGRNNDLIYIPKDQSEMNFVDITSGSTVVYTAQQQKDAWEKFIKQDEYLNANRGKYAGRGAVFMPMVFRADLSITQEVFKDLFGARNALQLRMDILNVTNLLNKSWGVGDRFVTTQPLVPKGADLNGKLTYQLAQVGGKLIDHTFEKTATINDVYQIQFGIRYTFN